MADKNLDDKKYDAIQLDSIIELKVNGKFFGDLRAMFIDMLRNLSEKDALKFYANFSQGKVESTEEYRLYILLTLINGIEEAAKEQGLMIKQSVPKDINPEFPEN